MWVLISDLPRGSVVQNYQLCSSGFSYDDSVDYMQKVGICYRRLHLPFSLPTLYWRSDHLPSFLRVASNLPLFSSPPSYSLRRPSFCSLLRLHLISLFLHVFTTFSILPYLFSHFHPSSSHPHFCRFVLKSPWNTLVNLPSLSLLSVLRFLGKMPLLEVLGRTLSVLRTYEGQVPVCWNKWSFIVRPSRYNEKIPMDFPSLLAHGETNHNIPP